MPAPAKILELMQKFDDHAEAYRSGQYNETQVRQEFLNPFFKALGWDMDNEQGYAEAYKDVIHEDAIKVAGATKAPDYCFRIGGTRKFFLEAKKPSVNIKDAPAPAYQLRRYAWSASLPLSILTDFEEFAVYDCRIKPDVSDKPSTARTIYLTSNDYSDRWEEIASVFSREAILKGSFDKYAESRKGKRGTATVDAAFLQEIEAWRELLAKNLALRNKDIGQRELNYAVQITIDRLIFLRMCEDRGIESYGQLMALLNGPAVYGRLKQLFRKADDRYNSGLFYFQKEKDRAEPPDDLTPALTIDDKPLKDIIRSLYYPESPHEFSVLPAEILGQVYEQFLGKVIRLTGGHQAKVEDKPEVKKAGGVYYTPAYIVDYIVKNTVGKLLEGKTPKQATKLRILDPACGSGSFLIGAYQYLLDWHRDRYVEDGSTKHTKELYEGRAGWKLTTQERKRILLNTIYGVDIDPQAVEVTKLSLLLKVLEGESQETIDRQLKFFHERALPDLAGNIKCGNSLIGPNFYDGQQMTMFDEEERYRINVFDWNTAFPQIMKPGGFDAVTPYVRIQTMMESAPQEVEYYKGRFAAASKGNYDIYVVFVERGLSLLNERGRLGFILPHKFFNAEYGESLRHFISKGRHLSHVVHFGYHQVFHQATTYPCLMFLEKTGASQCQLVKVEDLTAWRTSGHGTEATIPATSIGAGPWNFGVGRIARLFEKLSGMTIKLGDVASIFVGLQTIADKIYILEELSRPKEALVKVKDRNATEWYLEREALRPFLNDITVSTYERPVSKHWLIFPYSIVEGKASLIHARDMSESFPGVWAYLKENSHTLRNRESGKADTDEWYGYIYRKNLTLFDAPKLIVQVISLFGRYAYDDSSLYFTGGGNGPYNGVRCNRMDSPHSLKYLQGILGSRLLDLYLQQISSPFRGGYWSYGKRFIEQLPFRLIDFSKNADKARHDRMVEMVEQMIALKIQLGIAKTPHDKAVLQNQIKAIDHQATQLVYELYGLTKDEIKIVEEATA